MKENIKCLYVLLNFATTSKFSSYVLHKYCSLGFNLAFLLKWDSHLTKNLFYLLQ